MQGRREGQLAYWVDHLSGVPSALDLPSDRPRPAVRSHAGGRVVAARLSAEEWRAGEGWAVRHDAAPFMVVQTARACARHRVTGAERIVDGTPPGAEPHR